MGILSEANCHPEERSDEGPLSRGRRSETGGQGCHAETLRHSFLSIHWTAADRQPVPDNRKCATA